MRLSVLQGSVFDKLPEVASESIDLCITSPPYWGLRDYGVEGQLGNEPTMEAYLDNTLRWVKEVWRVLKPSGSFVLNLGDCFVGGGRGTEEGRKTGKRKDEGFAGGQRGGVESPRVRGGFYKPKQLLSISSFAYCRIVSETDFVCRGEHVWCKPNVPSPIRKRLKHSHEKLFWFVKDADEYYFDKTPWLKKATARDGKDNFTGGIGINGRKDNRRLINLRKKDTIQVETLNLGATSCLRKGNPRLDFVPETIEHSWRVVPVGAKANGFELEGKQASEHVAPFPENLIRPYVQSLCPKEGLVLDPFLGSGTTMRVAMEEGRSCTGIELNEKYIEYARKRCNWGQGFGVEYEGG